MRLFYWIRGGYLSIGSLGHLVRAILLLTGTRRFRMPVPVRAACLRRRVCRGYVAARLVALVVVAAVGIGVVMAGRQDTVGLALLGAATVRAVVLLFGGMVHHSRSIRPGLSRAGRWPWSG
jgi:hypothetical protein